MTGLKKTLRLGLPAMVSEPIEGDESLFSAVLQHEVVVSLVDVERRRRHQTMSAELRRRGRRRKSGKQRRSSRQHFRRRRRRCVAEVRS